MLLETRREWISLPKRVAAKEEAQIKVQYSAGSAALRGVVRGADLVLARYLHVILLRKVHLPQIALMDAKSTSNYSRDIRLVSAFVEPVNACIADLGTTIQAKLNALDGCCNTIPPELQHTTTNLAQESLLQLGDSVADIDTVEQYLSVARSKLRTLRNRFVPIHRLPSEIMSQILVLSLKKELRFLDAVDPTQEPNEPPIFSDSRARKLFLCTLQSVCKNWREITIGTAALWTEINLEDFAMKPKSTISYLERSKGCDLDFIIDAHNNLLERGSRYNKQLDEFLALLHPHISRCRSLVAKALTTEQMKLILTGFNRGESHPLLLQHLTLLQPMPPISYYPMENEINLLKRPMPRLTHFETWGFHFPWSSDALANLTSLSLGVQGHHYVLPMARLWEILRLCPRLQFLSLDARGLEGQGKVLTTDRAQNRKLVCLITSTVCTSTSFRRPRFAHLSRALPLKTFGSSRSIGVHGHTKMRKLQKENIPAGRTSQSPSRSPLYYHVKLRKIRERQYTSIWINSTSPLEAYRYSAQLH